MTQEKVFYVLVKTIAFVISAIVGVVFFVVMFTSGCEPQRSHQIIEVRKESVTDGITFYVVVTKARTRLVAVSPTGAIAIE